MESFQFYTYNFDSTIRILELHLKESEGKVDQQMLPIIQAALYPVNDLIDTPLPKIFSAKAEWPILQQALKYHVSESVIWPEYADSSEYFKLSHGDNEIHTVQFLGAALHYLLIENFQKPNTVLLDGIVLLQKKIEVFGRLFTSYSNDFRRTSDDYDHSMIYSMLSIILLALHRRNTALDYLNTALKLNDLLIATRPYWMSLHETALGLAALVLGRQQVKAFYDSQGFRLPADQ